MAVMEVVLGVPGDEGHCCSIRDLHHIVLSQVLYSGKTALSIQMNFSLDGFHSCILHIRG